MIGLQAFEAAFYFAHDVVSGEAAIVGGLTDGTPDFAGDDEVVAFAFYDVAENGFRASLAVEVGAVDEVAAKFYGAVENGCTGFFISACSKACAEAEAGDFDTSGAEVTVFQVYCLSRCCDRYQVRICW